jgi:phage regulator Rha-like protein
MELLVIQKRIYEIRGQKVMLDFDLAELYEVETKQLNQQVKRNLSRFPPDFMFQLTTSELRAMMSQSVTSSESLISSLKKRNKSAMPYAFTEHGVTMLASVLNSEKAIQMNIAIVRAFNALKQYAINYKSLDDKINDLFEKVSLHDVDLDQIYEALESILKEKAAAKSWEGRERIGFLNEKP